MTVYLRRGNEYKRQEATGFASGFLLLRGTPPRVGEGERGRACLTYMDAFFKKASSVVRTVSRKGVFALRLQHRALRKKSVLQRFYQN